MPLRQAHATVTLLFDAGEAVVDVPVVEDTEALERDLAKCNVVARLLKPEATATRR